MLDPTLAGTTLNRHFHICAFFHNRDEEYRVLSQFYKEGLDWGEKALHIVDPDLIDEHRARLAHAGVDVAECEQSGQLDVLNWQDAYLSTGAFDPDQMLATIEKTVATSFAMGYPRIRIMGNLGWVTRGYQGSEQVIEYEARGNDVLARAAPATVVCVYDTAGLSGEVMMDVLRAHPMMLIDGIVHENPLFTPPEQLLAEIRARRDDATTA